MQVETQVHATNLKSTNPFDFPYDSDLGQNNMVSHTVSFAKK